MKATKTNVLILVIALFLLLFPFAALYLIPSIYHNLALSERITFWCWFTLGAFITALWYWKPILSSRKGVKTKALILIVALFLLLFPLAAFAFPITPRSPGRSVEDHHLHVSFNKQVKNGLMATTRSEEFKQYFTENLSAIASEFPGMELTLASWDYNYSRIEIKWIYTLNHTEKLETGNRLADELSVQWYTNHAEYTYAVGDIFGYNSAPRVALICWILLGVLIIVTWPKKVALEKSSTKNIMERNLLNIPFFSINPHLFFGV